MKIVEYNNKYAALVADMWNKSGENWGNDSSVRTAEDVISRESKSGNIKLYLALDNDEVVGYCSFSEYEHDEGASYLPLLNVRPDYHGKKVGKALILKVIEDAVKAEWPRFDLFTWSGNIKAMPLYKKCGFFWEKNNQSVHLMNFIPYLYQTEAFTKYLSEIDWYKDSKRKIDMKQDGEELNGFDFFKYHFKNDVTDLRFEFEKSGRGLRLVETPDYLIEMSFENHELVFEQSYNVQFKLINKTEQMLSIQLEGVNNKNILANFNNTYIVEKELIVNESFKVVKTSKKQDKFKTYPVLKTNVFINGLKSVFKLGIDPKSPLALDLHIKEYNHILNQSYIGYLDLENNLANATSFEIQLPTKHINVLEELNITLQPKEKRSLQFKYTINEFGFINEDAKILFNDTLITSNIRSMVKGHNQIIHGETENTVYLVNGNYMIGYDKEHNRFSYTREFHGTPPVAMMTPQIGLPYNLEFSNIQAQFTYPTENTLRAELSSKAFEGVTLVVLMVNNNGILKVNYELINNGEEKQLALSIPIWKPFLNTVVPYEQKLLRTNTNEGGGSASIDGELIDENWLYDEKIKAGFAWDKSENVHTSGWRLASTKEGILLGKGETYKSGDYFMSYVHHNLKSFRAFAGQFEERSNSRFITLEINNGNPFISENAELKLSNKRKMKLEGTLTCDTESTDLFNPLNVSKGLKTITLDTEDRRIEYKRLLFDVHGEITQKEVDDSLLVDNGLLSFKVSNKYSDSVYSLVFDNKEWLDTNYPEPKERAWWGTFIGGINTRAQDTQDHVVLQEPRTSKFINIKDNYNNYWQGIKTTVTFEKEEDFKGLILENYFITLPGVPVLHTFTKITNNTGKLINEKYFVRFNSLLLDDTNKLATFDFDGITYKCGNLGIEKEIKNFIQFQSTRDFKLSIYNQDHTFEMDTQKDYTIVFSEKKQVIADRESKVLTGDYYIFTKEELKKEFLIDLQNIKFEV